MLSPLFNHDGSITSGGVKNAFSAGLVLAATFVAADVLNAVAPTGSYPAGMLLTTIGVGRSFSQITAPSSRISRSVSAVICDLSATLKWIRKYVVARPDTGSKVFSS